MTKPSRTKKDSNKEKKNLYEFLEVEKNASQSEIKRAYHKLALRFHPDKNPGDEEAKERFQILQRVYGVLGDADKRDVYDKTGVYEDSELSGEKFDNLYNYFRTIYKKVEAEDIEEAELAYRGSEEETKDLKELYTRFKGDMNKVFNWLICSQPELDSHRFMETLNSAMESGELKTYKAFTTWAAEVSRKPAPKQPLQPKKAKKSRKAESNDLVALISQKQSSRSEGLVAALEAKYCTDLPQKKGKKRSAEPTEEEFLAAQHRMTLRKRRDK